MGTSQPSHDMEDEILMAIQTLFQSWEIDDYDEDVLLALRELFRPQEIVEDSILLALRDLFQPPEMDDDDIIMSIQTLFQPWMIDDYDEDVLLALRDLFGPEELVEDDILLTLRNLFQPLEMDDDHILLGLRDLFRLHDSDEDDDEILLGLRDLFQFYEIDGCSSCTLEDDILLVLQDLFQLQDTDEDEILLAIRYLFQTYEIDGHSSHSMEDDILLALRNLFQPPGMDEDDILVALQDLFHLQDMDDDEDEDGDEIILDIRDLFQSYKTDSYICHTMEDEILEDIHELFELDDSTLEDQTYSSPSDPTRIFEIGDSSAASSRATDEIEHVMLSPPHLQLQDYLEIEVVDPTPSYVPTDELEHVVPSPPRLQLQDYLEIEVVDPTPSYVRLGYDRLSAHTLPVILQLLALFGGLSIGYLPGVVGGVLAMDSFFSKFSNETFLRKKRATKDHFCGFMDVWIQLYTASVYVVIGLSAILAFKLGSMRGRKLVLLLGSTSLLIGVGLTTSLPCLPIQVIGRLVIGFGIGLLQQVIPDIFSGLSAKEKSDKLNVRFSWWRGGGAVSAALVNWVGSYYHVWGWRLAFGVIGFVAFLLFWVSLIICETPIWLVANGKEEEAKYILRMINGLEYDEIKHGVARRQGIRNWWREAWKLVNRRSLIAIASFQILFGLLDYSVYTNYGPLLMQSVGLTSHVSFVPSLAFSGFGTAVTLVQSYLVSCLGRRRLYIMASNGLLISLVFGWIIFADSVGRFRYIMHFDAIAALISAGVYVLSYAMLSGPAGWFDQLFAPEFADLGALFQIVVPAFTSFIVNMISISLFCSVAENIFLLYAGLAAVAKFMILWLIL